MDKFTYLNTNTKEKSASLEALFPGWDGPNERVMVYSPHDDDAILGAGYAIRAAIEDGAEVFLTIVCNGHCGYSHPEEKDIIVETRRKEAYDCYESFGIPKDHILRLEFPDFSALQYVGLFLDENKREGHFKKTITTLRENRITRILVPNHYHEHIDHYAAYMIGAYDVPQAGDAILVDWAEPYTVKSTAQYSVWAELDPEDAILAGRDITLRASLVIAADPSVEDKVIAGIKAFPSQASVIEDLVAQRAARKLSDGRFIECYLHLDPRPKFNFKPYKDLFSE